MTVNHTRPKVAPKKNKVLDDLEFKSDHAWIWLKRKRDPPYKITGKYLIFSEDRELLLVMASDEICQHDFYLAKVNKRLLGKQKDYVLCLYYKDDSRKHELAGRYGNTTNVKYRYWKTDEATLRGEYSQEFLSKLSHQQREQFTTPKDRIVFRD